MSIGRGQGGVEAHLQPQPAVCLGFLGSALYLGVALAPLCTATAFDAADLSTAVTCTRPSGAVFPTGDTTVTCSAQDTGDAARGTFTVHVNTVAEQLAARQACVTARRAAARILSPTLHHAANALAAGDTPCARILLRVVAAQASALAGSLLPPADAAHISHAARRILVCLTAVSHSPQRGEPHAC
jgi:hypothetical protein